MQVGTFASHFDTWRWYWITAQGATTTLLGTGHGNIACFLPVSPFSRHLVLTHVINVVSDLVISFIHSQHLFILYLLITNVLYTKHMIKEKEPYIAYYDVFMLNSIVRRCWVEKMSTIGLNYHLRLPQKEHHHKTIKLGCVMRDKNKKIGIKWHHLGAFYYHSILYFAMMFFFHITDTSNHNKMCLHWCFIQTIGQAHVNQQ